MRFRSEMDVTLFPRNSTEILVTVIGSGIALVVVAKLVVRRFWGENDFFKWTRKLDIFSNKLEKGVSEQCGYFIPNTSNCRSSKPVSICNQIGNIPADGKYTLSRGNKYVYCYIALLDGRLMTTNEDILEAFRSLFQDPNEYCMKLSPKHKTPWIMYNGEVYSDSQFIIEFLNKEFDVDLSKHLTLREKAIAHSMRKMTEESFYWILALSRWDYDYDESLLKKQFQLSGFILRKIQATIKKEAYYQGYGRHSQEEGERICRQDLQALSTQIGQNMFLMGNQPCEIDSAIFGMLALLFMLAENSSVKQILKDNSYPNLTTYVENMKKEFWPDYKQTQSDEAEKNLKTS